MRLGSWTRLQRAEFESLPPKQAMQKAVYWGSVVMTTLLIAFTSFYLQRIPSKISDHIDSVFESRPWARPLAIVDGRNVVMRGTVEPGLGLEREVRIIRNLPGVRQVVNELDEQPLPSAEIHISRSADKIDMRGKLSGNDLDIVVRAVQRAYPEIGLRDRIQIDDRLGRPLWLDGLEQALSTLAKLREYDLHGWRDALLVDGLADSQRLARQVRYGLPASLDPTIRIDYQIRTPVAPGHPSLSLIAGWNGAAISARVADMQTGNRLESGFGSLVADSGEQDISKRLKIDGTIKQSKLLSNSANLIPALDQVHDLRLETSADGLVIWGRVDTAQRLGEIVLAIEQAGLSQSTDNQIFVDAADRAPEISLFRDSKQAIITGRLPNHRSRENLLTALQQTLGVDQVEDFINIEPNIAFTPWLEQWSILKQMPRTVFGLTVADDGVFVSGQVSSRAEKQSVTEALESVFPDMQFTNWLTVAGVSFQGAQGITPMN